MVPFFTILSSPSSEQLVGPSPVSLGEDLLGPDGSFCPTGLATTDGTHASAMPLVLYLLLVFARDESAPSHFLPERAFHSRYGLLAILIQKF